MDPGFITLMRKLAPDLTDEITRRALILERIAAMQPVGRRQLAAKLNLPEREIRNTAAILKDLGYIDLDASVMSLSDKADEVLETSRAFSKAMSGLTEMETRLCDLLPVDRVLIALSADLSERGIEVQDLDNDVLDYVVDDDTRKVLGELAASPDMKAGLSTIVDVTKNWKHEI